MQLSLDKFGRMVLPKRIRDDFHLKGGDKLDATEEGDCIVLRPLRATQAIKSDDGILVFSGRPTGKLEQSVKDGRNERLHRLPLSPRISPGTARHLIRVDVEKLATIIDLDQDDYKSMLDNVSAPQLSGGVVYDAISVEAARKFDADTLLTLNESDFRRIWPDAGARISAP